MHVLVRGPGLADSMSRYLIQRIESTPNITLRTRTQIVALEGDDRLEAGPLAPGRDAASRRPRPIRHVFLMTGADPNTAWLDGCVVARRQGLREDRAPICAGGAGRGALAARRDSRYLMESSIPGVFAVGDARATSVKRVASAVGEGSICIQLVHRALAEL